MPVTPPPGAPIIPGITTTPNKYPQWAVGGGTPGNASGWKVVKITDAAMKAQYVAKGWAFFVTQADAQAYVSSESSAYGSGEPQNALPKWIANITGFNGSNFITRALKIIVGGALVIIGIAHMTGASNAVATLARKVPLPV